VEVKSLIEIKRKRLKNKYHYFYSHIELNCSYFINIFLHPRHQLTGPIVIIINIFLPTSILDLMVTLADELTNKLATMRSSSRYGETVLPGARLLSKVIYNRKWCQFSSPGERCSTSPVGHVKDHFKPQVQGDTKKWEI